MAGRRHYQAVERALYDLGRPAEVEYPRPRLHVVPPPRQQPGPRGPFRETLPRLELTFATRSLTDAERQVVRDHYILGVRRLSRRERAPVIQHLISLLRVRE